MAYDIPPPLQHKEKILFGLTFQQLGYAVPAFLLLVIVILKLHVNYYVSGTIGIFISLVAVFFMFFDGLEKLKNWYNYLRKPKIEALSKDLKRLVDIKKIEHGTIQQSSTKLAILEVIPMNFMLRTDEEKQSTIVGFQKFLNSLDFPVQLHITSTPITLTPHFSYTDKKVNDKIKEMQTTHFAQEEVKEKQCADLKQLLDSYCNFVRDTITNNNILNRKFYLILKEKDSLELQVKVCTEQLQGLGLKVKQLKTEEIIVYFHDYIAQKKNKVVEQEEIKDVAHFLYAPEQVSFLPDSFQVDDLYCKVLVVTGYPHRVELGFLDKIISSGEKYDISIHIEPFPIDLTMIQLNRDLQKQQADLYAEAKKGIINPSLEIKFKSTRKVLEDLQKGKQKLFNVSLYIMCKENIAVKDAKKKVDLLAKKVTAMLEGLMIQSKIPSFQMMEAYGSMLPLAQNMLGIKRNIHTEGLAAFFPFSSPFLDIENDGILLGLNKNKIPYIKNVFHLANANGIILATSGAGKSYFTKLLLSRQYMNGCDIIIIDPQGEYLGITKQYNGERITISKDSKTMINPLDLMGHEYAEKRLSLMDLFKIMFEGDMNELQKSILDKAIDETYENRGFKKDPKNVLPPTISELYKKLETSEKRAVHQEKVTYRALMNRVRMYTEKGVFGFLDKQSNLDFSSNFVCFNIGNMPKQVKPVIMYLILDYVFMKMKESKRRKLLVIDEAWSLLQTAEESSYIFEIVKTCRKYNLGLLMITQDVADLVGSRAGHAVLANTSYTFLLRQKPAVISAVSTAFHLSHAEREFLMSAKPGSGILILENEHQEIEVIASPDEHKLITTNPDELVKESEAQEPKQLPQKEDVQANLDLSIPVFSAKGLTPLQQNVLNNHEYILKKCHNLESGPFPYYIKPLHPESAEHTFLVYIIYEEIKKYTSQVWTYQTKKPDIVFVNGVGQEIALEIETGFGFDKHKDRLVEKFAAVKKEYNERVYIVLTDLSIRDRYKRFETPLLSRTQLREFIKLQFSGQKNSVIGKRFNLMEA